MRKPIVKVYAALAVFVALSNVLLAQGILNGPDKIRAHSTAFDSVCVGGSVDTITSPSDCGGGLIYQSVRVHCASKTTTYTTTTADGCVVATSGTWTLTLHTAVGVASAGQWLEVSNDGTGVITLATTSGQTISGVASGVQTLSQWDSLTLRSNGTVWTVK